MSQPELSRLVEDHRLGGLGRQAVLAAEAILHGWARSSMCGARIKAPRCRSFRPLVELGDQFAEIGDFAGRVAHHIAEGKLERLPALAVDLARYHRRHW